jgi:hypothetical protein
LPSLSFTGLLRFVFFSWQGPCDLIQSFHVALPCCLSFLRQLDEKSFVFSCIILYFSVCFQYCFLKKKNFLLLVLTLVYFLLKMLSCFIMAQVSEVILFLFSLKLHRKSSSMFDKVLTSVLLQFLHWALREPQTCSLSLYQILLLSLFFFRYWMLNLRLGLSKEFS